MDEYVEKYLYDVLMAIDETLSFFEGQPKLFDVFQHDVLRQRAVERNV